MSFLFAGDIHSEIKIAFKVLLTQVNMLLTILMGMRES